MASGPKQPIFARTPVRKSTPDEPGYAQTPQPRYTPEPKSTPDEPGYAQTPLPRYKPEPKSRQDEPRYAQTPQPRYTPEPQSMSTDIQQENDDADRPEPQSNQAKEDEYQLHTLCRDGITEEVKQYLQANRNVDVNTPDKYGNSPIHYTIRRDTGDVEDILLVLCSCNVDTNARTLQEGDTSLHIIAKRFTEEEAVILTLTLLSKGADPDYRNDKYRTPYDIAVARNMITLAEYLSSELSRSAAKNELEIYRKSNYGPKLVKAVIDGKRTYISMCLQEGADPNHMNQHGAASIHYAITHCPLEKMDVLKQLVESGADVNLQDYEGDTALNLVIKSTQLRNENTMENIVKHLMEWGSDQTLRDLDGKDAFLLARERNYDNILAVLKNENRQSSPFDSPKHESRNATFSSQASLRSASNKPGTEVTEKNENDSLRKYTPDSSNDRLQNASRASLKSNVVPSRGSLSSLPTQPARENSQQGNNTPNNQLPVGHKDVNASSRVNSRVSNNLNVDNTLASRSNSRRSNRSHSIKPVNNDSGLNENSNSNRNNTPIDIQNI